MSDSAMTIGAAQPRGLLDVSRDVADATLVAQFRSISEQTGLTMGALIRDFAKLSFGPGSISFPDFIRLRLFDEAFHQGAKLDSFVGQRRNRDLCVTINHRHDWLGLMSNKVASMSYLAAYGLPTIPIGAIYAAGATHAAEVTAAQTTILRDRDQLRAYLLRPDIYPLFGKPVESFQSLGSVGLTGIAPNAQELIRLDGTAVEIDHFVDEIETHYPAGYMFQSMLAPHADIAALCGRRLATARIVTIATEDGPRVFRASWKIPAGANAADNYWRAGNLLAQIDMASGRVGRVTSGNGLSTMEHAVHPDSGVDLIGFHHPQWAAMLDVALEGARLMRHMPLIGWDIACTAEGVVIVEMNETPDFFLVQFADRRGVLGEEFAAFTAFQKARSAAHNRSMKAAVAKL